MSTLCAILACVVATAQDITITSPGPVSGWSRFRGPNGAGRLDAGGLPTALDPTQNLRWRTPLPKGHSSPVLWQDRVYLTALDGDALCTLCLDADTGRLLWRRVAPRRGVSEGESHRP